MNTFTLDTSGFVRNAAKSAPHSYQWPDLSPFAQRYVEAMLHDQSIVTTPYRSDDVRIRPAGFSDLAPETLAAILRDCDGEAEWGLTEQGERQQGRDFWTARQAGRFETFPPLTPYLGDDGKVRLRETREAALAR